MITISKSTNLVLVQLKAQPYQFTRAVEDAYTNSVDYTIARTSVDAPLLVLTSKAKFDAAVAAITSQPLLISPLIFDQTSAARRADEIYHVVLGLTNFPGNLPNTDLQASGFEHKIVVEGSIGEFEEENLVSADGAVTASMSINSADSVSARKPGAALVVSAVDLTTGVVQLSDGGSPIADGVAVQLVYQALRNTVIYLTDRNENVVAVILSSQLNDYLAANA